jgi:hypothetical protein
MTEEQRQIPVWFKARRPWVLVLDIWAPDWCRRFRWWHPLIWRAGGCSIERTP